MTYYTKHANYIIFSDIFDINEPNSKVLQHVFYWLGVLSNLTMWGVSASLGFSIRKADKANKNSYSSTFDRQFGLFVSHMFITEVTFQY